MAKKKKESTPFEIWVNELIKEGLYFRSEYPPKYKNMLKIDWCTGGLSGGTCWNDGSEDHHHAVEAEPEPDFEALEKIFEKYYPDIPWLVYKSFCRENIQSDTYTNREYYGNYYHHAVKMVDLQVIFDFLKKKGKV